MATNPKDIPAGWRGRSADDFLKRWKSFFGKDALTGYLFIAPNLGIACIFTVYAIFYAFTLSLYDWNLVDVNRKFVGFQNYIHVFVDPLFMKTLKNTLYFTGVSVPVGMALSLVLALFLNMPLKSRNAFRSLYFLPSITPIVAIAQVWIWIYEPTYGILNWFLGTFGIPSVNWLFDPNWAMPAVILMNIWKSAGYNMVIYIAALQDIPESLYEAAEIDGAGRLKKFLHVTLPGLKPANFFILVTSIIGTFQTFAQIFVMTQGGPMDSTNVIAYYLYQYAFKYFKIGYACSVGFILFAILFICTLLQWKQYSRSE